MLRDRLKRISGRSEVRFPIRMAAELKDQIEQLSREYGVSQNEFVTACIEQAIEELQLGTGGAKVKATIRRNGQPARVMVLDIQDRDLLEETVVRLERMIGLPNSSKLVDQLGDLAASGYVELFADDYYNGDVDAVTFDSVEFSIINKEEFDKSHPYLQQLLKEITNNEELRILNRFYNYNTPEGRKKAVGIITDAFLLCPDNIQGDIGERIVVSSVDACKRLAIVW